MLAEGCKFWRLELDSVSQTSAMLTGSGSSAAVTHIENFTANTGNRGWIWERDWVVGSETEYLGPVPFHLFISSL